ncbi:amidinotransferase [Yinghuangia aomiensis]|uniref:Amidinotransferase n=1 Tax=Yinghuangia aomiensis TaxID=676205 RepID=A0ABP9GS05_9ACTN
MRLSFPPPAGAPAAARPVLPERARTPRGRVRLPRPRRRDAAGRPATPRHYVMCPPTHLPAHLASAPLEQWEAVRETLLGLGHRVSLVTPRSGMPGMVLAGHAATVVDGRVLGARYRRTARQPEAPAYLRWFAERGFRTRLEPVFAHEGASDLLPAGRHVLAAAGPHTELRAHSEAGQFLGLPVVPLELTDPRFTRLGGALTVLTDRTVAYFPGAFSAAARERLARLFPEHLPVGEADALAGGLDAVCDGRTVVLTDRAPGLAGLLARHGFRTVGLDVSGLVCPGAGVRSCVLELRDNR